MNREWTAKWIGLQEEDKCNPVIYKDFFVDHEVKKATLYIASLSPFEAYINGTRIGNEYLTPYKIELEKGVPYFEYDITENLNYGEDSEVNSLDVFLGTGWDGSEAERFALKAEIVIETEKTEEKIEYLPMSFDEILVKPGTFSDKPKKKETLDDIIDFDDLILDDEEVDSLLGGIINNRQKEVFAVTEEAEELLEESDYIEETLESSGLDNLFSDDLFDEFIDEIIEGKKGNKTITDNEISEKEDLFVEAEELFEDTINEAEEYTDDLDFDLAAELIGKAGFEETIEETKNDIAEIDAETETIEEVVEATEEEAIEEAVEAIEEEAIEEVVEATEEEVTEEAVEAIEEDVTEEVVEVTEKEITEEIAEAVPEAEATEEAAENSEKLVEEVSDELEEVTDELIEDFETEENFEEAFAKINAESADSSDELFDEEIFDDELDEILEEAAEEAETIQEDLELPDEVLAEKTEELEEAVEDNVDEPELLKTSAEITAITEEVVAEEEEIEEFTPEEEALEEIEEVAPETEKVEEATEIAEETVAVINELDTDTNEADFIPEEAAEVQDEDLIVIATDETWGYYASDIESSGYEKGEVFNRLLWIEKENPDKNVAVLDLDIPLVERYSDPITIIEELKAEQVVQNAAGEELLDFGKTFTGYLTFTSNLPEGTKVVFDYVNDPEEEIAQPGFTYIADGIPEVVSAHFSYFKGRYVKVSGWNGPLQLEDFTAKVLFPEEIVENVEDAEEIKAEVEAEEIIEETEETSEEYDAEEAIPDFLEEKITGEKTEKLCRQTGFIETSDDNLNRLFDNIYIRQENLFAGISDEELQDTADKYIDKFTAAACYNMDVKDDIETLLAEQKGKSLVTVPWTLYNMYGDISILEKHFDTMKTYVDEAANPLEEYYSYDDASEILFFACANYYEAADIVEKAATALNREEDVEKYNRLAADIKKNLLDEYFTPSGRNFLSTQEELVTSLRTGIYSNKERLINDLKANFKEECFQIVCGPEETPVLCKTLAENGLEDLAYRLLFEVNNCGWFYSVEESDTAIWTSKNAINEDGTVDKEILEAEDRLEYGAITEFLYAEIAGIKPMEPGFQKIELAPIPNSNLIFANAEFQSSKGKIVSNWEVLEDGKIRFHFEIPEGTEAKVVLPACEDESIAEQILEQGIYDFEYMPTKDYMHLFNEESTVGDILKYQDSLSIVEEIKPELAELIRNADKKLSSEPLDFLGTMGISEEELKEIKGKIFQLI